MAAIEERCVALAVAINSLCDMEGATDEEKAAYLGEVAGRDAHTKDNLVRFYGWSSFPGAIPASVEKQKAADEKAKADAKKEADEKKADKEPEEGAKSSVGRSHR